MKAWTVYLQGYLSHLSHETQRHYAVWSYSFDYFSKELPEMPILILFTIINICFDFRISIVPQWQEIPLLLSTKCFFFFFLTKILR